MIPKNHPYWHVRAIVERNSDIETLSMSYYTYQPRTVVDNRSEWQIPANEFVDSKQVEEIIAETPSEQELAIHSLVRMRAADPKHIVMIDMSTSSKAHLEKLKVYLGDHLFQRISWFNSGRSFHGYGEDLLSEIEWVRFMGVLLLANQARIESTVDPRWIGHRLLAGYAALRWTKNTSHYWLPPSKIDQDSSKGVAIEVGALGKSLRRDTN